MAAARPAIVTGKSDISSLVPVKPADSHVIEIGKFVVEEVHHGTRFFVAVIGGFTWSEIGGNYYALIIENQDADGATFLHKALVFKIPGQGLKLIQHWK